MARQIIIPSSSQFSKWDSRSRSAGKLGELLSIQALRMTASDYIDAHPHLGRFTFCYTANRHGLATIQPGRRSKSSTSVCMRVCDCSHHDFIPVCRIRSNADVIYANFTFGIGYEVLR